MIIYTHVYVVGVVYVRGSILVYKNAIYLNSLRLGLIQVSRRGLRHNQSSER